MTASRLASVFLIFVGVSAAWGILGASVNQRTQTSLRQLHEQVAGLWGSPLAQGAPQLTVQETIHSKDAKGRPQQELVSHQLVPDSSDLRVSLHSDARRKGLLWYRTYTVEFDGAYTLKHTYTRQPELIAKFFFPAADAIYDDFRFSVNGEEAQPAAQMQQGLKHSAPLPPGKPATIEVHYKSRGLDNWTYVFDSGVSQVKNFKMVVDTDFQRFDFPARSLSPTRKEKANPGWRLTWEFASLISGFQAGVEMPEQTNPGPVTARITYFAPVGLLF